MYNNNYCNSKNVNFLMNTSKIIKIFQNVRIYLDTINHYFNINAYVLFMLYLVQISYLCQIENVILMSPNKICYFFNHSFFHYSFFLTDAYIQKYTYYQFFISVWRKFLEFFLISFYNHAIEWMIRVRPYKVVLIFQLHFKRLYFV